MGAGNYNPSTIQTIGDLICGLHVETTKGVLVAANFTTGGTNTSIFNVYGRIGIMQLFIELTAAADANATQVLFYCTFTTPVISLNAMCAKCASIASLGAYGRIYYPGGAVATNAIITDSAGLTDVATGGIKSIIGGESSAGVNTVGVIGMQASDATQAGTIAATGHIFYVPMSPGAYVTAAV
jgi:hypothetical protein